MDHEQKKILLEKKNLISRRVSLKKIKPLLIDFKIFNKYMWQDIKFTSDVCNLLPSRGPKAFENFIKVLKKSGYDQEAAYLENSPVEYPHSSMYKMSSIPLGYCLIINNVKFDYLEERWGSDADEESLKNVFENIGYQVSVARNMKTTEMQERLQFFSKSEFQKVDSSVVIILSHGAQFCNQDVICGTDGKYTLISDIINIFSNKNCPKLQGKPKMFFFLACRLENKDYGVLKPVPSKKADNMNTGNVLPTLTDTLVIHSSLPNHISIRDHVKGTWFCQDLVGVLQDYHGLCDLDTIIKIVNTKLMKRISISLDVTQVAHTENFGITKILMLCRKPSN